ncbi:MAG TPA: hypothetical protein VK421_04875 [Pyrinomonadaceae bacterium]|nr:hypothetical protein [Pyrinomonadaceae bacterium]
MTRKHTLVIAAGVSVVLAAGWISSASKNPRPQEISESEKRGTFRQQVARAKSNGAKKIQMTGLVVMYEQVRPLDGILDRYDLVLAQPVEVRGYVGEHDSITSWYRLKILETISRAPDPPTLPFDPPAEFSPVADDELLLSKSGGTVTVDGVEVTLEEHNFPALSLSKQYLLFLRADRVRKVASADLGPTGALMISDEGFLESVGGSPSLKREVEKRYGKSLGEIKRKIGGGGVP